MLNLIFVSHQNTEWSYYLATQGFNHNIFIVISNSIIKKRDLLKFYGNILRVSPHYIKEELLKALATCRGCTNWILKC